MSVIKEGDRLVATDRAELIRRMQRMEALRDGLFAKIVGWLLIGNGAGLVLLATAAGSNEVSSERQAGLINAALPFGLGVIVAFLAVFWVVHSFSASIDAADAFLQLIDDTPEADRKAGFHATKEIVAATLAAKADIEKAVYCAAAAAFVFIIGTLGTMVALTR